MKVPFLIARGPTFIKSWQNVWNRFPIVYGTFNYKFSLFSISFFITNNILPQSIEVVKKLTIKLYSF